MSADLVEHIVKILDDNKAEEITVLEVTDQIGLTDYFVIASGQSLPHLNFLNREVKKQIKDEQDKQPLAREGSADGGWLITDYGTVIVHLFLPKTRRYYNLEGLWADAPELEPKFLKS